MGFGVDSAPFTRFWHGSLVPVCKRVLVCMCMCVLYMCVCQRVSRSSPERPHVSVPVGL